MRVYLAGEKVLANCGTRKEPDWIPGEVMLRELGSRPNYVRLDRESDGKLEWYFRDYDLMQDNPRNRKRHGL